MFIFKIKESRVVYRRYCEEKDGIKKVLFFYFREFKDYLGNFELIEIGFDSSLYLICCKDVVLSLELWSLRIFLGFCF